MKDINLEFANLLFDINTIAAKYGISSTLQLSVFLKCANNEGKELSSIFDNLGETQEQKYTRIYNTVRKLMLGSPSRNDGLKLLYWGGLVNGLKKEVFLSSNGKRLFSEIKNLNPKQ